MKLKENSFILTIGLLPFIFLLSILLLKNFLKGKLYIYLLIIMIIAFWISFIFSMFFALDEIKNSNNKKRIILLMVCPFVYLPVYYTKYIYKNEKNLGYGLSIINVILIGLFFFSTNSFVNNYMIELNHKNFKVRSEYAYVDKNKVFSININNNFTFNNNLGDYVIACDNKEDDSFLGIYSYQKKSFSKGALDDILDYHVEQTVNYIEEYEYVANIEKENDLTIISYNNMKVLIKQIVYEKNNQSYCLVIVKEVNEDDLDMLDFEKSVENISFLV